MIYYPKFILKLQNQFNKPNLTNLMISMKSKKNKAIVECPFLYLVKDDKSRGFKLYNN